MIRLILVCVGIWLVYKILASFLKPRKSKYPVVRRKDGR